MIKCRYLGRACIEIITKNDHLIFDPNYVKSPQKGISHIFLTHEHDDHLSPEKIEVIYENLIKNENTIKVYGPISIKNKIPFVNPIIVKDGSLIEINDGIIEVFSIDCWKSEACVAYLITVDKKRILHTADSANYSDRLRKLEKGIDCCFIATFEDFYQNYLQFIKIIMPKLTIPYHFGPDKKDMGKNTAQFLKKNNVKVKYLDPGEELMF
jgi:L-ascorbate metabolism protein UlaG (beta-lactamase superfamily)